MQCHTAPHTWKLLFESQHRVFEIMLSACSAKEGDEWKSNLSGRITAENRDSSEGRSNVHDLLSIIPESFKPLSSAFSHVQSLARRMSIQRAATLVSKAAMRQVVIKDTQALRISTDANARDSIPVARSQSLLSSNHVQTLAPRRAERIRLEVALSDVWTKEVLPYPGMASRRPENPIRASANSVMRKLSMASIASNFSKRSTSYASVSTASSRTMTGSSIDESPYVPNENRRFRSGTNSASRMCPKEWNEDRHVAGAPRVDFHNAPSAFLPEDFELKPQQKQSAKCHTMTAIGEKRRGLAGRIGAGQDYLRELRPLTPILATGRSSGAEGDLTLSEALKTPSLVAEGRNGAVTPVARMDGRKLSDPGSTPRPSITDTVEGATWQTEQRAGHEVTTSNSAGPTMAEKKPVKTKRSFLEILFG